MPRTTNIGKRVAAENSLAVDLSTGLEATEREEIKQVIAVADAEKRIAENAIPESNRDMILQEIRTDDYTTVRRYVELTPSMCEVRGCGYDSAREMNVNAWGNLPVDTVLPSGKTVGQRAMELKEYHKVKAHTRREVNDHIISEAELRRRQWAPGQDVFLEGAR